MSKYVAEKGKAKKQKNELDIDLNINKIATFCRTYKLPSKSDDILIAILKLVKNNQFISTKTTIDKICKATDKSPNTVNKYWGLLIALKFFTQIHRGFYSVSNPFLEAITNGKKDFDLIVLHDEQNNPKIDIVLQHSSTLPATIPEAQKIKVELETYLEVAKATLKAIDKLDVAADLRIQVLNQAQAIAEALLDVETRIGELILQDEDFKRGRRKKGNPSVTFLEKYNITKNQSSFFQKLALHKPLITQLKEDARKTGNIVFRKNIMRMLKQGKPSVEKDDKAILDIALAQIKKMCIKHPEWVEYVKENIL